jgi:hypothetical protein
MLNSIKEVLLLQAGHSCRRQQYGHSAAQAEEGRQWSRRGHCCGARAEQGPETQVAEGSGGEGKEGRARQGEQQLNIVGLKQNVLATVCR